MAQHICCSYALGYYLDNISPGTVFPDAIATYQNSCWGTLVKISVNGSQSSFIGHSILARRVGEIFEEVINELCLSYHSFDKKSISATKVCNLIIFFFKPLAPPYKGGRAPIDKFIKTMIKLWGNTNQNLQPPLALESIAKTVLRLVVWQHLFDPEQFVSHNFAHSLMVARHSAKLFKRLNLYENCRNNTRLNNLDPKVIEGLIKLVSYLHDCGYPHLKDREKANHSVYSADKSDELKDLLQTLLFSGDQHNQFGDFYKLFRDAIFFHNADECHSLESFTHTLETDTGNFLLAPDDKMAIVTAFSGPEPGIRRKRNTIQYSPNSPAERKGRKLDLLFNNDGKLGLAYTRANLNRNPFEVVRVADNLDFAIDRLTTTQQANNFLHTLDASSLKHFASVASVSQVVDYELIEESTLKIYVALNRDIYNSYIGELVNEKVNVGHRELRLQVPIAQYQMFRAIKAFCAVDYNGTQLNEKTAFYDNNDRDGEPIYGNFENDF